MPIPKPNPDENQQDFIDRCMADDTMVNDYKETERTGVCETAWNKATETANKKDNLNFVVKDDDKREVTGPVLLPGCPDCDFKRGEKIFTVDEVAKMCRTFNAKFRLSDQMHIYGETGQIVGDAVENYTLKHDETTTNINGETITLPRGTWMTTIKVTDDDTWEKIKQGTYRGFSGTFLSEKDANELYNSIEQSKFNSMDEVLSTMKAEKRTLIADLENPVPVTISIVDRPCVPNAIFTSVKMDQSDKAGRTISNSTYTKIKTIKDSIMNSLGELEHLFDKAKSERQSPTDPTIVKNDFYKEVEKMEEKEFNEKVEKAVEPMFKAVNESLEAIKTILVKEPESKKECDCTSETKTEETKAEGKTETKESEKKESEKKEPEIPEEVQKTLDKQTEEIAALKKKLGEGTPSNAVKEPEKTEKKAEKSFYDRINRTSTGRPKA